MTIVKHAVIVGTMTGIPVGLGVSFALLRGNIDYFLLVILGLVFSYLGYLDYKRRFEDVSRDE